MIEIFQSHPHWPTVLNVLSRIQEAGYQALLAGGCVRDGLLGCSPKDFDIATEAHPEDLEKIFPKSIEVGRQFGVLILPYEGFQLEIATFREEGEYLDGRRPSEVRYSTAEEDAKRRDFTVNALFYDPLADVILDYVQGQQDLSQRILRTVGDPLRRFTEDKLRILRALRFQVQLGFDLEENTARYLRKLAGELKVVSKERQRDEFSKMLAAEERSRGLELLHEFHIWPVLCPSYAEFVESQTSAGEGPLWSASRELLRGLPEEFQSELDLWTLWLLPFYIWQRERKGDASALRSVEDILMDFKHARSFIQGVKDVLSRYAVYMALEAVRPGHLLDLLLSSEGRRTHEIMKQAETVAHFKKFSAKDSPAQWREAEMRRSGWNWQRPSPLITGADLVNSGEKPGPGLGSLLQELWYLQLENPTRSASEIRQLAQKVRPSK